VIAGTHGKTTTTALAGWLLADGGADPTIFVGGIARDLGGGRGGSYRVGRRGGPFVIEGDEYDSAYFDKTAKFLKYLPDIAVINNIEFDHADIYPDLDAVRLAFRRLVNLVPRSGMTLIGGDSADALALVDLARSRVETFGLGEGHDWRATDIETTAGRSTFRAWRRGQNIGSFRLPLIGGHNVRNALAAIAVGVECGVTIDALRDGLAAFKGIRRRLDIVGTARGVTVYDDFAHHPTAVAATLAAVHEAEPHRRVWAIFEPRSASSCRRVFQDDFARAFGAADRVIIASVFRSTLPEAERLSESQLVADLNAAGVHARHVPSLDGIIEVVACEAVAGDLVVVMSNGGFGGIHRRLLEAL
jgi:UDP-N-acetylmuramate: L-alanyl-gamma-D-glutamyl-meso-diaminopimelate ligase